MRLVGVGAGSGASLGPHLCTLYRYSTGPYVCWCVGLVLVTLQLMSVTWSMIQPQGVSKVLSVGEIDSFEKAAMDAMLPQLKQEIQKGISFAQNPPVAA